MRRPVQAVILAGGRGTRLQSLTRTRPKPMVHIQGRPFLEYQIEQLRDQGFEKVLLLLGYLPEVVQNHFGDGSRWGIKVEYSISPVNDETVRRLKHAESRLAPYFMLLYCDNYWPMYIERMWSKFLDHSALAMIGVYSNKDGYTRNNVRVDSDGYVVEYDKTGSSPGLQGVEISYAVIDRSVMHLLPDSNVSLESALYAPLARRRQLLAYVSDHRYYSVGATQRLPLTEAFFARVPTVILDRDGVINRRPGRAEYIRRWSEFAWLPGAKEALRLLKAHGFRVLIVSNQAGVARGVMTETDLEDIHKHMTQEAEQAGGRIEKIYYCPHDWNAGCTCRKPSPGMLYEAQKEFHLDLTRTVYIGDDERDRQAAEAAGCRFAMVTEDNSLLTITQGMVKLNG